MHEHAVLQDLVCFIKSRATNTCLCCVDFKHLNDEAIINKSVKWPFSLKSSYKPQRPTFASSLNIISEGDESTQKKKVYLSKPRTFLSMHHFILNTFFFAYLEHCYIGTTERLNPESCNDVDGGCVYQQFLTKEGSADMCV